MKLITPTLIKQFRKIGNQSSEADPIIICKFFNPTGSGAWYASEYNEDSRIFFGYVSIFGDWNDEWGYFSLDELESFRGMWSLGIERDLSFESKRFSELNIDSGSDVI